MIKRIGKRGAARLALAAHLSVAGCAADVGSAYVEIGAYGGPPREPLAELAARARNLGAAQLADLP